MTKLTVYHIPVCPFCQRLEILLTLKGRRGDVDFQVIDITQPRPDWLLQKTRGSTALPVLETTDGRILKESLVILQYLEQLFPQLPVAQADPYRRAVENMLCTLEREFGMQGYQYVMNRDISRRDALRVAMLAQYARLDSFLREHAPAKVFLFDSFGWAETVFTPFFMRFWFLEYYEEFVLPDDPHYARVRTWIEACVAHPAAQQVTREEIVKLYYDYAQGVGNGVLLPGRRKSSFAFNPAWHSRPWPPADKYRISASDADLGL